MTVLDNTTVQATSAPITIRFAANWPVRKVMFRIAGTALILSASGMWLLPGSHGELELMFLKLGTSVFFLFCGLALLMRNHEDAQPDALFDPTKREVRVIQKNDRGRPEVIMCRSYDSLGGAEFNRDKVELFDVDGSLLMKLTIQDDMVLNSLKSQLATKEKLAA